MGISSPKMRTQVSQIKYLQKSEHFDLRRKHHKQIILFLNYVYNIQTLFVFSRYKYTAFLPDNVIFKKASIKRFFRYRAYFLTFFSARSSVIN